MKEKAKIILSLLLIGFVSISSISLAQEPSKTELENVLKSFKSYRFGTVSLYQIKVISEVKRAIEQKERSKSAVEVDDAILKTADPLMAQLVENEVKAGSDINIISQEIIKQGREIPPKDILNGLYNYYKARQLGGGPKIDKVFIITSRPEKGGVPNTVISMIVSINPSTNLEKNLKRVNTSDLYTYDELKEFKLDSSYSANNMYDLMINALVQQNFENRSLEMQGIGTPGWFAPKIFGGTQSLISNEANMSTTDIQKFLRISEEQPDPMGLKQHELILSPDLISWRMYNKPGYFDYDANSFVIDSFGSANNELPVLGIELKYGLDDINYQSFWSERLTAYAIWNSIKLGLVLPTSGWSNLANDWFDQNRMLTHANIGVAGEFDFPFKVIPKSGLFHFAFSYVFGDAVESDYKARSDDPLNYIYSSAYNDYLIRLHANLLYTFGLQIDDDFLLRFGVGGTVYNVERWFVDTLRDEELDELVYVFKSFNDETIGGLTGRVEFMSTNVSTPWGASLQYFDEGLSGNIWLQIPIIKNLASVRFDAKGFSPVFRNINHSWETGGIFTPMARIIINF